MLEAQIVLYSLSGITPSPVGSVYGYGQVASGDLQDVRFRAANTGTASITITLLKVLNTTGTGFSIVNSSSTPFVIAPGNSMDFFVRFSAIPVTSYAATLEVGTLTTTVTAILLATVVPAPTLSVAAPCSGPDTNNNISFGQVAQATQQSCIFSILNPFPQDLTVSPLSVTGAAFTTSFGSAVTVPAGQTVSFTIQFFPPAAASFSGTLTVGTRAYTLTGTGSSSLQNTQLPPLVWTFDSTAISSGEQHTLTLGLSAPSPVTAAGSVTLLFTPSTAAVSDDAAVQFVVTSKRIASFSVAAGAISINGQPNIVFSTGTTAGTITFTVNPGSFTLAGSPSTTLTTHPAPIVLSTTGATSRANELDVVISGFDNTYSMGDMSFSFFDRSNKPIVTMPADFTASFKVFLDGQTGGSTFLMRASFAVTGDVTQVGGVAVTLTNSAGVVNTPTLNFP